MIALGSRKAAGSLTPVALLLVLLFLVLPIAELAVIVQVSDSVGLGNTLGLLLVVSLAGAWLVKRQGLEAWRRLDARVSTGEMPGTELVDGVMILVAGALLLTPGFITDAVGLGLLLPPVRVGLRGVFRRWFAHRVKVVTGPVRIGEAVIIERERRRSRPPAVDDVIEIEEIDRGDD
jgi:UPF0716 protein FxsA